MHRTYKNSGRNVLFWNLKTRSVVFVGVKWFLELVHIIHSNLHLIKQSHIYWVSDEALLHSRHKKKHHCFLTGNFWDYNNTMYCWLAQYPVIPGYWFIKNSNCVTDRSHLKIYYRLNNLQNFLKFFLGQNYKINEQKNARFWPECFNKLKKDFFENKIMTKVVFHENAKLLTNKYLLIYIYFLSYWPGRFFKKIK